MEMIEWAENECRIACKKENPNFNFDDDKAFDYGCSCYKSALKAYKSLCEDGHSGHSWAITRNILIRLMNGQPLTPITDNDFPKTENIHEDGWLKRTNLKSSVQCPRMNSLFSEETLDGKVIYHDIGRAYYINIENPSDTYYSNTAFLDEMFPITMPHTPEIGKYKIYAQSFLVNPKHGDFDTRGILYVITPDNKRIDVDIYETEDENGKMVRISKEDYLALEKRRVDKVSLKVANNLILTLLSNSGSDDEIKAKEEAWKIIPVVIRKKFYKNLENLCVFYDNCDNWKYNTFHMKQALCNFETEEYKDIPELVKIAEYLKEIYDVIMASSKENK